MNKLMIFLPIAICGLVGVIAGFCYASVERNRTRSIQREHHPKDAEPYLPFAETTQSR